MKSKEAMVMLTAKIPKVLLIKMRVEASRRNLSRSELVRQIIENFLYDICPSCGSAATQEIDNKKMKCQKCMEIFTK
jgi:hypothetical protein